MEDQLQATPICGRHRALNALMAPFGGWDMPIQYEGIIAEHSWCRTKASLFDICHMGEFLFQGDFDESGLEDVFTFSVKTIPVGRSRYGFLLNEQGGIIDDLIVFRLAEDKVMIVVNAATAPKDFAAIKGRLRGGVFTDITAATGKLDIQGPLSRDVMVALFGKEVATIPYFKFITMNILGVEAIVSRTGYTGELGYEIFIPSDKVCELWDLFLQDERVKPAGLGARDVLRLEVGYSLYGSDIDEETTPLEAGLEGFVNFDKVLYRQGGAAADEGARRSQDKRWPSRLPVAVRRAIIMRSALKGRRSALSPAACFHRCSAVASVSDLSSRNWRPSGRRLPSATSGSAWKRPSASCRSSGVDRCGRNAR